MENLQALRIKPLACSQTQLKASEIGPTNRAVIQDCLTRVSSTAQSTADYYDTLASDVVRQCRICAHAKAKHCNRPTQIVTQSANTLLDKLEDTSAGKHAFVSTDKKWPGWAAVSECSCILTEQFVAPQILCYKSAFASAS